MRITQTCLDSGLRAWSFSEKPSVDGLEALIQYEQRVVIVKLDV